jgi:hypothetical protein
VLIAIEDHGKNTFFYDFGSFSYRLIPFSLKNAPMTFSRIAVKSFQEYFYKTMALYYHD